MDSSSDLAPPLREALEDGVDLTQLYERLSLTPTERIKRNFQMAVAVEELKRAGERHRDGNRR